MFETFENEKSHKKNVKMHVTKNKYSKKISTVKNEKIKKSLEQLEKLMWKNE